MTGPDGSEKGEDNRSEVLGGEVGEKSDSQQGQQRAEPYRLRGEGQGKIE